MRKRVGLAAEPAAVSCADDADSVHRHLEDFGQRAVDVMDDLRRRPESHLAVDVGCDGAVLLHRQVGVALEEEDVLANVVGALESALDVTKLQRDQLVNVIGAAVVLDALVLRIRQRGVDGHDGLEHLVLDCDGVAGGSGDLFVGRGHGGDGVADVAHLLVLQRALVLGDGEDAELDRQVRAGDHGLDARDSPRRRRVD